MPSPSEVKPNVNRLIKTPLYEGPPAISLPEIMRRKVIEATRILKDSNQPHSRIIVDVLPKRDEDKIDFQYPTDRFENTVVEEANGVVSRAFLDSRMDDDTRNRLAEVFGYRQPEPKPQEAGTGFERPTKPVMRLPTGSMPFLVAI